MTPLSIDILMRCYWSPEPIEDLDYPSQQEVIRDFLADGMIEATGEVGRFTVTEKGRAHVEQLCNLPYPVAVWMGGDGKPIYP